MYADFSQPSRRGRPLAACAVLLGILGPASTRADPDPEAAPAPAELSPEVQARVDALLDGVAHRARLRAVRGEAPPSGPGVSTRLPARGITPMGQLPRPKHHTPLFRKRHATAARSEDGRCFDCHPGVERTARDNCQSCHALSVPRNHDLRFRTVGHGRVSARDPAACATCHEVEFCTECHNIPPSNHQPLAVFRGRHARAARGNPRSCMTCHSFEVTCERCHALDTSVPVVDVGLSSGGLRR